MSAKRSHLILGCVYFDPDDPRVLVPMFHRLGWSVNFGNPGAVRVLGWICAIYLLGLTVVPIVAHWRWFAHNPADLLWLGWATLTALLLVRLNPYFAWSDYGRLSMASFGVVAAGIGFALQRLINGPLMLWWGDKPTLGHHLVLGPVAAVAQTFGKWFALSLLLKVRPVSTPSEHLRQGLLTGLGFAVFEFALVYFRVAWAQIPLGYLSLWERGSASMFHIYSGGLIGLALWRRRLWPLGLVVGVHAVADILAGAGTTLKLTFYGLESIISGCAILLWAVFLLAGRSMNRAGLPGDEAQLKPTL